jgi:hypothetical protein
VVENFHPKQFAGTDKLSGCLKVFGAWVGRSSRVIVRNNDAVRIAEQGGLKHLSWVNQACRQGSMRNYVIARQLIPGIEVQSNEMFFSDASSVPGTG